MMTHRKSHLPRRFDFEIGYLIKSPCKTCAARHHLPGCMKACEILDCIQTHLAQGVSSCRSHSPMESFKVELENRHDE